MPFLALTQWTYDRMPRLAEIEAHCAKSSALLRDDSKRRKDRTMTPNNTPTEPLPVGTRVKILHSIFKTFQIV